MPNKCTEKGLDGSTCNGEISEESITLGTGRHCGGSVIAFPCEKCGALYREDGSRLTNRPGELIYLIKGGIYHVSPDGEGGYRMF